MSRCVVTGCGMVSAIGNDCAAVLDSLRSDRCGITPLTLPGHDHQPARVAAALHDFTPEEHFTAPELALYDPFAQYALVAAQEAVTDAGVKFEPGSPRAAVIMGTGIGGITSHDDIAQRIYPDDKRLSPLSIVRVMMSAVSSHVSMRFGVVGPTYTVTSACASSAHAIGIAAGMIKRGELDIAIAGGTEAPLCYGMLRCWEAMRILDSETCRPFSKSRRGLVLGEGAGVVVLESAAHAEQRGATPYAEIAGFGFSADARNITVPSLEGQVSAMRAALDDAGLQPSDVDYVNAHGTGTQINDTTETRAIRNVFGDTADRLYVSSTKGAHGHCIGASAAMELICTMLGMRHGFIPPTLNYTEKDPECDLNFVPNHVLSVGPKTALSNAFAFGGLNACLVARATA
jgi:nodulation protein E